MIFFILMDWMQSGKLPMKGRGDLVKDAKDLGDLQPVRPMDGVG